MEDLNPSVRLLISIRYQIEAGASVKGALLKYFDGPSDSWTVELLDWWANIQKGEVSPSLNLRTTPSRQGLLSLLERGILGEAILVQLKLYEEELTLLSSEEVDRHIGRLPLLLMVPVVLFMFPSLLLLIFGPLVLSFLQNLQF